MQTKYRYKRSQHLHNQYGNNVKEVMKTTTMRVYAICLSSNRVFMASNRASASEIAFHRWLVAVVFICDPNAACVSALDDTAELIVIVLVVRLVDLVGAAEAVSVPVLVLVAEYASALTPAVASARQRQRRWHPRQMKVGGIAMEMPLVPWVSSVSALVSVSVVELAGPLSLGLMLVSV
jgi:hypothetical protein